MDRWLRWVIAIIVVAAIVGLVALARGEPGHGDPHAAATIAAALSPWS